MDFDSKLSLLFVTVVLHVVVCTDGAKPAATTIVTTPNTTETTDNVNDTTITTTPAGTTTPVTKAPVQCNVGTCVGEVHCTNTTVTKAYNSTSCPTGVCLTVKTVTDDTFTHHFKCSSKDCTTDKTAAPKDAHVFCCEKPNCNTYESVQSSATRMYSISTAVWTWIVLIISM